MPLHIPHIPNLEALHTVREAELDALRRFCTFYGEPHSNGGLQVHFEVLADGTPARDIYGKQPSYDETLDAFGPLMRDEGKDWLHEGEDASRWAFSAHLGLLAKGSVPGLSGYHRDRYGKKHALYRIVQGCQQIM